MDYEKKYKDAMGMAEEIIRYYKEHNRGNETSIEDLEQIFPELKESKDEKIRKELINVFSNREKYLIDQSFGDITVSEALAWLEKQGHQPSAIRWYDVSLIPQEMEELLVEWDSEDATWHEVAFYHADTKTFWNGTRQVENVTRWCYIIDLLEKQGEQKPFDYEHATITQKDFASVGETATIELSSPIDCGDRIYHVSHKPIEKQGEQKVSVVDFNAKDWYVSKVDGKIHNIYHSVDKVEPRFKVKYAGSEYNVLEVKDIAGVTFYGIEDEPNHIDYVKAENCEIISGYAIKENGSPYPTKPAVFSEKKPTAWSEEDDYNLQCVIAKVTSDIQKGNVGRNNELIDWLKSLKERVQPQPKQKWSEEDKRMCQETIDWFEKKCFPYALEEENPARESIKWLKSLKNRM